jgi:RecA/RadA recombinase
VLDDALGGGFECGKVTELWGPPGAGKTAIAYAFAKSITPGLFF